MFWHKAKMLIPDIENIFRRRRSSTSLIVKISTQLCIVLFKKKKNYYMYVVHCTYNKEGLGSK